MLATLGLTSLLMLGGVEAIKVNTEGMKLSR